MNRKISRVSIIRAVEDPSLIDELEGATPEESTTTRSDPPLCKNNSNTQTKTPRSEQFLIEENFIIIWLNLNNSYSDREMDQYSSKLQCVAQSIERFTDADECVNFLTDLTDEEPFLILSGFHVEQLVFIMDDIPKLHGIYILDRLDTLDKESFQQCNKLKGIFNDMEYISTALNQHMYRLASNAAPFSIISVSSSPNLGQLDQSFMYTQLIKEIIVEVEHDSHAKDKFVQYCLDKCRNNDAQSRLLREFQQKYRSDEAILWYAREWFIYSRLNVALRLQDTQIIIKMAFFIRDLHQEIEKNSLRMKLPAGKFTVYRGQQMSNADFEKLKKNKNSLMAFNSFLSTSLSREVAKMFVEDASTISNTMGILFRIEIDPLISSVSYVNIDKLSGYMASNEQEILFSMQTIFRIGEMKKIHEYLWEIDLTLVNDTDTELQELANFLKHQWEGIDGWYRMVCLMLYMGKYDDATEIFHTWSETTLENDPDMTNIAQAPIVTIATCKCQSTEFRSSALLQLKETVKRWETTLSPDHCMFAFIYSQISTIYQFNGNFDSALQYAKRALDSLKTSTSPDAYFLSMLYSAVGDLYASKQNNEEALIYLQKALDIRQKSSLLNEPFTSVVYMSLAKVYKNMNSDTMAIFYVNKTREIQEKFLPLDHILLGTTYFQLGQLHQSMGNNEAALSCYEKVLEVCQIFFSPNHLVCATICNCIAALYQSMDEHEKALGYSKKALSICETWSTFDNSDSIALNTNMAVTHIVLGDGKAAIPYLKKTLELRQGSLASNHLDLINLYNLIGKLHYSLDEYAPALSFFEKQLELCQQYFPSGHPKLGEVYNELGMVYISMGDYDAAGEYLTKALEIQQKTLPFDDPKLGETCSNIADLMMLTGDCPSLETDTEITDMDS